MSFAFLKNALLAGVMATSTVFVGIMVPISPAQAQAVPFPPCRNDFRAEIASGQRSPHYPRCLDAHSPRGPSLQGAPQIENQAFNCPSGQVFSGGSCVSLPQNQGAYGRSWTSYFVGQTKCSFLAGDNGCATIQSDGSIHFSFNRYHWLKGSSSAPIELNNAVIYDMGYDPCGTTFKVFAYPAGFNPFNGSPPTDWGIYHIGSGSTSGCS